MGGAQALRHPNLVLVVASGWRAQTLPSAGDNQLRAPNLARLAAEGVHCDRVYAACPHAASSLWTVKTGRFPHARRERENEPSLEAQLKSAGYMTGFNPGGETGQAIEYIRQNRRNPFYLLLALEAPRNAEGSYDAGRFEVRENVPRSNEELARDSYARYYSGLTAMDGSIGQLLKALEENGQAAGTIVVFTSDQGEMLGSHGLESADEPYEESVRVPLLIRYPVAVKAGSRIDFLISNVDLMPTLLGLCGAAIPAGVQGRNLAPLLLAGSGERPESVFAEGRMGSDAEWRMMVRGFDKLVIGKAGEVTHLYNLSEDPFEMHNQSSSRADRRRKDELTTLLELWRRRTNDGRSGSGLKRRGK